MDYSKISNIKFEGVDYMDSPDFVDAFIVSANYDGIEMTKSELKTLNNNRMFVHEALYNYLY